MNVQRQKGEERVVVVPENNKLQDDLLPEVELGVTPCKLTDNVRVDLYRLDDAFVLFLVKNGNITDSENNDVQMMTTAKFPKFCQGIRDAFRTYNLEQHADLQV